MRIHREGTVSIVWACLLVLITTCIFLFSAGCCIFWTWISYALLGVSLIVLGLILNFFRNPIRTIASNSKHILAPCDGKVVVIEEVVEPLYFQSKRLQISIFMSPLNVHVNRNPISGRVKFVKYFPGKYLVAWHPKSSTENEQTYVVTEDEKNGIVVGYKQIAGFLARRIKCYAKENNNVQQGEEYGFIKFGSRVDIFLPLDAKIAVQLEQKTIGGQTILATI